MSNAESTEIRCPECDSRSETVIWSSINRDVNPEAKQELLAGRVNRFHCAHCGFEGYVPVPLLYVDPIKGFCVYFSPIGKVQDGDFLDQFTSDGQLDAVSDLPAEHVADYFRNIHLVFSMGELARYVYFRDRLAEREAGLVSSGYVCCFSCDGRIKEGETSYSVSRIHQMKGDSGEDDDDVIDSLVSLQVCCRCMARAAKETVEFREKPLPVLRLERNAIHQLARSLAGRATEWEPIAEGRDACSFCGAGIEVGNRYRRVQLSQEVWSADSAEAEVMEERTLAILCDSCSDKYLILV